MQPILCSAGNSLLCEPSSPQPSIFIMQHQSILRIVASANRLLQFKHQLRFGKTRRIIAMVQLRTKRFEFARTTLFVRMQSDISCRLKSEPSYLLSPLYHRTSSIHFETISCSFAVNCVCLSQTMSPLCCNFLGVHQRVRLMSDLSGPFVFLPCDSKREKCSYLHGMLMFPPVIENSRCVSIIGGKKISYRFLKR